MTWKFEYPDFARKTGKLFVSEEYPTYSEAVDRMCTWVTAHVSGALRAPLRPLSLANLRMSKTAPSTYNICAGCRRGLDAHTPAGRCLFAPGVIHGYTCEITDVVSSEIAKSRERAYIQKYAEGWGLLNWGSCEYVRDALKGAEITEEVIAALLARDPAFKRALFDLCLTLTESILGVYKPHEVVACTREFMTLPQDRAEFMTAAALRCRRLESNAGPFDDRFSVQMYLRGG